MSRFPTDAVLEREIDALTHQPRPELVARWHAFYKTDPPKGISRTLLIRATAYAMQVKATRGLKPAAKRRLIGDDDAAAVERAAGQRPALKPGAQLIREWNGTTYRIDVTDRGFIWKGAPYRSLSAIARAITGTRWSGPRFFGLTSEDAS